MIGSISPTRKPINFKTSGKSVNIKKSHDQLHTEAQLDQADKKLQVASMQINRSQCVIAALAAITSPGVP